MSGPSGESRTSNDYGGMTGNTFVAPNITLHYIPRSTEMIRVHPTSMGPGFYCVAIERVGAIPVTKFMTAADIIAEKLIPEAPVSNFVKYHMECDEQNRVRCSRKKIFSTLESE